jgi:hypothetical protein
MAVIFTARPETAPVTQWRAGVVKENWAIALKRNGRGLIGGYGRANRAGLC